MKKVMAACVLSFTLLCSNSYALESISCSESLDETGSASGKTDVGLGTTRDGSSRKQDWEFSIDGEVQKIGEFIVSRRSGQPDYKIIQTLSGSGRVGVSYSFYLDGCMESRGRMEKRNIGGFAGGRVTQVLKCGCSID